MQQEFYFQWHITNHCNLRCAHCYQEGYQSHDLKLEKLLCIANDITTSLKKWDMLGRVALTGGEPFLSPNVFTLLTFLENDDRIKELAVLTNGTCTTDEHVEKLQRYEKLSEIQVSLDGATEETHDAVRGKGSFEKATEAIRKLREANIKTAVMFTLTKQNKSEAIQMLDLSEQLGVDAVTIERVTPCGNSTTQDILTADEIRSIYETITVRANSITSGLKVRRARPLWALTEHLNGCDNKPLGGFCPVGFTALTILHDGTVLPCRRLNIPIGNLLEEKLFKIWYGSEVLWRIRDKNNLQGKCNGCENIARCGGCRAIAYETTGDCMGEDIQCWI